MGPSSCRFADRARKRRRHFRVRTAGIPKVAFLGLSPVSLFSLSLIPDPPDPLTLAGRNREDGLRTPYQHFCSSSIYNSQSPRSQIAGPWNGKDFSQLV